MCIRSMRRQVLQLAIHQLVRKSQPLISSCQTLHAGDGTLEALGLQWGLVEPPPLRCDSANDACISSLLFIT